MTKYRVCGEYEPIGSMIERVIEAQTRGAAKEEFVRIIREEYPIEWEKICRKHIDVCECAESKLPTRRELEERHRARIDAIEAEFQRAKDKYLQGFTKAMADYEEMYAKVWQHPELMED